MNQPVTLKGVRSGIALQMDPELEFEELLPFIQEKFESSASFFGNAHMVLSLEGRQVSEEEVTKILDIIGKYSRLVIVAVLTEDEELEKRYSGLLSEKLGEGPEDGRSGGTAEEEAGFFEGADTSYAEIHIGTLRSGTSYVTENSLIVLGDVKRGAEVTAAGSIFVLGSMLGIANAGCTGDKDAFVMAIHLDPLQVRIADKIAISEDRDVMDLNARGIIEKMKRDTAGPEAAILEEGHIVIKKYDNHFLQSVKFLRERERLLRAAASAAGKAVKPEFREKPEEITREPEREEPAKEEIEEEFEEGFGEEIQAKFQEEFGEESEEDLENAFEEDPEESAGPEEAAGVEEPAEPEGAADMEEPGDLEEAPDPEEPVGSEADNRLDQRV